MSESAGYSGYRRPYAGTQPDYLFPRYASTVKRAISAERRRGGIPTR